MEGKKICYFHKFNFCKKKDCKYFHPSEVCEEKCDIRTCFKRHLQTSLCMFHIMFQKCRNKDSCKFLHETPQPVEDTQKEEIKTLKRKIQELEEDNRNIKSEHVIITDHLKERIIDLEASVKDLISNMATLISNNEMIRLQEEEMMEDNITDNNDESNLTNDSSYCYDMWEDLEFKEILKDELCVTNNLKTNINDIIANLKPRKIQETMIKLATLNYNVQNDKIRLKSIARNSKNEHKSEEFYKMIENFKNVMEKLENTANNKFKKVAENDLKEIYKSILKVQSETANNLYGMFDKTIDEEI